MKHEVEVQEKKKYRWERRLRNLGGNKGGKKENNEKKRQNLRRRICKKFRTGPRVRGEEEK
jgi:hypothetical protein